MQKSLNKVYEVSFHIISTLSDKDALKKYKEIAKQISSLGGKIISEDKPELIDLAYEIRHTTRTSEGTYDRFNNAYLSSIKFTSLANVSGELRTLLEKDSSILRVLLIETIEGDTRFVMPVETPPDEETSDKAEKSKLAA